MQLTMIKKIFMLTAMAALLVSCADDLFEGNRNVNALRIEVVDGAAPTPEVADSDSTVATRVAMTGYHSDFETGDEIGVYAFDGTQFVASNVKFTRQSDGTWATDANITYNATYTYYAYYPYVSNPYTPATDDGGEDVKFANFIADTDNKFWKSDQSTKANFDASNLMISEGTTADGTSTVRFIMNHKRGLAVFHGEDKEYTMSTGGHYTLTMTDLPNTYPVSGDIFYYIVKPKNTDVQLFGLTLDISQGRYKVYNNIRLTGDIEYQYSESLDGGSTWSDYTTTKPEWLTANDVTQEDGPTFFYFDVTVNAATTGLKKADPELQAKTPVSDVDLSTVDNAGNRRSDGVRTTANTYLVHGPGTYKIPLVYGNAYKDGAFNISAYYTSQTQNTLQTLVRHDDQAITNPWIKNNGITVNGAKLVWEDMKGMITSTGISGDYLTFTVDKDNIAEGNAVIAATSNGTVVWSWNIWVTKQTLSNTVTLTKEGTTYKLSTLDIGAVDADFYQRKCRVRTSVDGIVLQYEVTQPEFTIQDATHSTVCTYYQWGRSVAEPPATAAYKSDGSAYTPTYGEVLNATIGTNIQHPEIHYNALSISNNGARTWSPCANEAANLWNINNTNILLTDPENIGNIVKTVYDPCPPDYCVPYSFMITLLYNKYKITHAKDGFDYPDLGLFFPYTGRRGNANEECYDVGVVGYFASNIYLKMHAKDPNFASKDTKFAATEDANGVNTNNYDSQSYGHAIRPVAEP